MIFQYNYINDDDPSIFVDHIVLNHRLYHISTFHKDLYRIMEI